METPKGAQVLSVIAAVLFVTVAMAAGYITGSRRVGDVIKGAEER